MQATQEHSGSGGEAHASPRTRIPAGAKASYDRMCRYALLSLCFIVPVQGILDMRTYRVVEAAILLMGVSTFMLHGRIRLPALIKWSFWIGLLGWLISTCVSISAARAIDVGLLEFLIFYVVYYLMRVHLNDKSDLVVGAVLFGLGAGIVAAGQTIDIISVVREQTRLLSIPMSLPFLPSVFLQYKAAVPQFFPQGVPRTYGNIDNYVSLWVLLLPWLIGLSYYLSPLRWLAVGLFLLHLYAGLIVYSRGATLTVMMAIAIVWLVGYFRNGRLNPMILAVLVGLVFFHVDHATRTSFTDGVRSFADVFDGPESRDVQKVDPSVQGPVPPGSPQVSPGSPQVEREPDQSGADRAQAWLNGVSIGIKSRLLGVGYGSYPIFEPALTAPHSLAVLRFAEGGLLGLLSFAMLAAYAPWRLVQMLRSRSRNMLRVACVCAVSAFMLKAILFGANFAISSNIVWGFGVALCLATCVERRVDRTAGQSA